MNRFAPYIAGYPTGPIVRFFGQHLMLENVSKIRGVGVVAN